MAEIEVALTRKGKGDYRGKHISLPTDAFPVKKWKEIVEGNSSLKVLIADVAPKADAATGPYYLALYIACRVATDGVKFRIDGTRFLAEYPAPATPVEAPGTG